MNEITYQNQDQNISINKNIKKFKLLDFEKSIKLNNISFNYKDKKQRNLENINLEIKKNSISAVVGPSGSGKSTLIDLLCGFNLMSKGLYLLDDNKFENSQDISFQNISYGNQDQYIFSGTLENNITFFQDKNKIDKNKFTKAVELCQVNEIMKKNNLNLNHEFNEKGSDLSGGEKQRINLARAIYYNTGFLALDEPLSSVEKSLEEKIISNIFQYLRSINTTLIIISHSVKSVKDADQIIVVKDGKIEKLGLHENLIKENEFYKSNYLL